MFELTMEKAVQFAREAIEEKGEDFVYSPHPPSSDGPACTYAVVQNDEAVPDCIVGNILHRLGLPMDDFVWRDGGRAGKYSTGAAYGLLSELELDEVLAPVSEDVRAFLYRLQYSQDDGYPWGESLRVALGAVNDSE